MSCIKATQIDGDVSVGRNIAIGGKVNISGDAKVGHNLKVSGWFEAPNIRDINKGIFLSLQELEEVYPNPRDGWIAGVGASTPFTAYTGHGGVWEATGGTIDVTFDSADYDAKLEQMSNDIADVGTSVVAIEERVNSEIATKTQIISELQSASETQSIAINEHSTSIGAIRTDIETINRNVANNDNDIANNRERIESLEDKSRNNETAINEHAEKISKNTPIEVASEEAMQTLIDNGEAVEGQLYYIVES